MTFEDAKTTLDKLAEKYTSSTFDIRVSVEYEGKRQYSVSTNAGIDGNEPLVDLEWIGGVAAEVGASVGIENDLEFGSPKIRII